MKVATEIGPRICTPQDEDNSKLLEQRKEKRIGEVL